MAGTGSAPLLPLKVLVEYWIEAAQKHVSREAELLKALQAGRLQCDGTQLPLVDRRCIHRPLV